MRANEHRFMGFIWGVPFGICLAAGIWVHPSMFLAAVLPIAGCYLHREIR